LHERNCANAAIRFQNGCPGLCPGLVSSTCCPLQAETKIAAGSGSQLAQRIFAGEQITITQVSKRTPILEAYVQSLDLEIHPEAVLDDAYFLGKLGLNVDSPNIARFQALAFGASPQSRRIRVNTGDHWALYPDGYVDMLFVDLGEFDEYHYALTYSGRDRLADRDCIRVAVLPLDAQSSGRFTGDIWVDETSFRIVRIAGSFSPKRLGTFSKYFNPGGISRIGLYLHFESWRQQVAPGVWLPSYTYFDEQRMWNTGRLTTSFHLRGHIWLWNYQAEEYIARVNSSQNPLADWRRPASWHLPETSSARSTRSPDRLSASMVWKDLS